jgi:hypothetical protein
MQAHSESHWFPCFFFLTVQTKYFFLCSPCLFPLESLNVFSSHPGIWWHFFSFFSFRIWTMCSDLFFYPSQFCGVSFSPLAVGSPMCTPHERPMWKKKKVPTCSAVLSRVASRGFHVTSALEASMSKKKRMASSFSITTFTPRPPSLTNLPLRSPSP